MGPGLLVKSVLQRRFSLMLFGWSQIVMDIQPLTVMLTGQGHLHGFTHTYLGASGIAIVAAVTGKPLAELGLRLLQLNDHLPISWWVAVISSVIGTFSHVLFDSIKHRDVQPFAPWRLENPFLGFVSIVWLHLFCLATGLAGMALYPLIEGWLAHNHPTLGKQQS